MKRIVLFVLMLVSVAAISQPANYLNIRSRYNLIAVKTDSGFHVPGYSTIPNYRGGVWTGSGNVGVDTVNHKFYFYSGGSWREAGSTNYADSLRRSGLAVQMRKNGVWTTQFNLPDSTKQITVGDLDGFGSSSDGATIYNDTLYMQLFGSEVPGLVPSSPMDTTHYLRADGAWDDLANKADTSDLIGIDTTGVQDGDVATWDAANKKVIFEPPTGGGSTDSTWHISFKTGVTTYAPAAGDSTFKHSYLVDKVMDVYREGVHQVYDDSVGYTYVVADTTIKFFPVLDTNERVDIVLRDSTRQRWLVLENNSINATEINYEGSSDVGNNGASSNILTTQYTVSPNENRILIVGIIGDVVNGADDITSVSYSGSSMTFSGKTISYQNRWQYLYYLMNPPSGAHNIVINSATVHYLGAGAIDYSGVAAIDSVKTSKTDYNATTHTSSITTEKNNSWVVCFEEGYSSAGPATAGAGLFRRNYQSGFNIWTLFDSNGPISPAGVYTITTNRPNDNGFGISHNIIVIKPY